MVKRMVGDGHAIDVDHRHCKSSARQEVRQARCLDPRMDARRSLTLDRVRGEHRPAKQWKTVPAHDGAEQQPSGLEDELDRRQGQSRIVGGLQQANA